MKSLTAGFAGTALCLALAGCAQDPLRDVERLSEVPLGEEGTAAAAIPAEDERGEAPLLLSRIFSGTLDAGNDFAPAAESGPVAFGEARPACGLDAAQLGTAVAQQSGYVLHDPTPGETGLHRQYVTGFADGCPREVMAALGVFGDVGTHEVIRYGDGATDGWSPADTAYEELKARVCRVNSGQPCGGRIDRLARETAFLTLYAAFGDTGQHAELLLHDGTVLAGGVSP